MLSVELTSMKIGSKLNLTKVMEKRSYVDQPTRTYVSQILYIDDNEVLRVAMPIYNGKLVPLGLGDRYDIVFYTEKGLFTCVGEIIKRYKDNNVYVLVIGVKNKIVKHQRRQFYRLDCTLDFLFRFDSETTSAKGIPAKETPEISHEEMLENIVTETAMAKAARAIEEIKEAMQVSSIFGQTESASLNHFNPKENPWMIGTTQNISGGGIRFIAEASVEVDDVIVCRMNLNVNEDTTTIEVIATVIYAKPISDKMNEIRVQFGQLSKGMRDLIVKFIFEEERRIRRREAGLG